LGLVEEVLLVAAKERPRSFGELAKLTVALAVVRAYLLHLLWHRRLGLDLSKPLVDATCVTSNEEGAR
jgi:hypothetical protein